MWILVHRKGNLNIFFYMNFIKSWVSTWKKDYFLIKKKERYLLFWNMAVNDKLYCNVYFELILLEMVWLVCKYIVWSRLQLTIICSFNKCSLFCKSNVKEINFFSVALALCIRWIDFLTQHRSTAISKRSYFNNIEWN